MLDLFSTIARARNEVDWVLFTKDIESLLKSALLNQAMAGEISAGWVSCNQILFREEALRSSVIACREMNLRKPESVLIVVYRMSAVFPGLTGVLNS